MEIKLLPVNEDNKDAVLALSVREDQPFVAPNDVSLRQAEEANAEHPGVARPFGIYADDKLVGFCMFVFDPEEEDEDDRYWLWRFMIDQRYQGKGLGRDALHLLLDWVLTFPDGPSERFSTTYEPTNEAAKHLYTSFGFLPTGEKDCDDEEDAEDVAVMMLH